MLLGEERAESVQASLGECSTILKPLLGYVETARRYSAGAHSPDLLGADQVTLLQNLQVLYHRRQGHRERRSQFTDRQWTVAQPLQQCPARGISQGLEDGVDAHRHLRYLSRYLTM